MFENKLQNCSHNRFQHTHTHTHIYIYIYIYIYSLKYFVTSTTETFILLVDIGQKRLKVNTAAFIIFLILDKLQPQQLLYTTKQ